MLKIRNTSALEISTKRRRIREEEAKLCSCNGQSENPYSYSIHKKVIIIGICRRKCKG